MGTNSAAYFYDIKGRLTTESKVIDSSTYTTAYTYDGADGLVTHYLSYGEVITNEYNGRGLPGTLKSGASTYLVNSTAYNASGNITGIAFSNTTATNFGYWGLDHQDGVNPARSYGKLWEIKTVKSGSPDLQDVQHTWDETVT